MKNQTCEELKAGLADDIQSMRLQILRLQNQILKNKIVIEEIEVHERCMDVLKLTMVEDAKAVSKADMLTPESVAGIPLTVPDMVKAYLAALARTDKAFSYTDIMQWIR